MRGHEKWPWVWSLAWTRPKSGHPGRWRAGALGTVSCKFKEQRRWHCRSRRRAGEGGGDEQLTKLERKPAGFLGSGRWEAPTVGFTVAVGIQIYFKKERQHFFS